jgi:hypothetical protein
MFSAAGWMADNALLIRRTEQKFFGSFFKKELLPFTACSI